MPQQNVILNRFNYGMASPKGQSRFDIDRIRLGAEIQTNIIGRDLGAGVFRPGMEYIGSTYNNSVSRHIPFVFAIDDTAVLEITDSLLRVRVDDDLLTRTSVSTAVTNGNFTTDISGWTDASGSGASAYWSSGFAFLSGNGEEAGTLYQLVTVASGDQNKEHAVRFVIDRGPVIVRIGSTLGGDEYVSETTLETDAFGPGTYSFAFTPTGDFYVQISNRELYADSAVDSVTIESSGTFTLPVPYTASDLDYIRYAQSGNVVYLACDGIAPKKIIRYGDGSWGVSDYRPNDGPFGLINTSNTELRASGLNRQVTLTSNVPYFKSNMVGELFKLTSTGQQTDDTLTATGQATNYIKVIGVGAARDFQITVAGTWSGTLQIQRSITEPGAWAASGLTSITANGTYTRNDGDDNSIYFYRILFFSGSGSPEIQLSIGSGSVTGTCRVINFTSSTSVEASVLTPFGSTDFTDLWYKGEWGDNGGYPSSVSFHEGRLWWAGKSKLWGSISDAYESFDDEEEGDSGPINIAIGSGAVDRINWLLSLFRLVVGGQTAERTARSTSLDEPLTPTNISLKTDSTRGSSPVDAVAVDQSGFFVRNDRLFNVSPSDRVDTSYQAIDVALIAPEVGDSGFKRLAVQRYPDTRIHALRNDGKVALFVYDEAEEIKSWQLIETDGTIEDVFVLPAQEATKEDDVYYVVNRTINGATKRYLEKWAKEDECVGGILNKQADSFLVYLSAGSATIPNLQHLAGEQVVVWADGRDLSDGYGDSQRLYTVNEFGILLLPGVFSQVVVGLPYTGKYKTGKLTYASANGQVPINQRKRVNQVGFVLENTHSRGLLFGPDFDTLDDLPGEYQGALVDYDTIYAAFDEDAIPFNGEWSTDPRICLQMNAPRPATILSMVPTVETHDKF